MKQPLFVCIAWLFMPAFAASAQERPPDLPRQDHRSAAASEAAAGNLAEAMAEVRSALARDPRDATAWYQLGSLLGQTGDFPGAEAAFQHAIALRPDLAKAHYGLALALVGNPQGKQDWPGAMDECRKALKLQPAYPEALNLLGAGFNSIGQPQAAVPVLKQSIALSPALSEAHFNLALALESIDQLDQAAEEYQAAIATRGGYPEASSALGKLMLRMGKTSAADQQLRAALKLNPDLIDAHYTLARVLRAEKNMRGSEVEFAEARALTERPSNGIQASQLSNSALQIASHGDLSKAIDILQKAIALKPDYGVPHYNLGLLLADTGDTTGALQELAKAISLLPGQAKPWFDYGRVQERAKDNRDAIAAVEWAAHLSPSDEAIHAELIALKADAAKSIDATTLPEQGRPPVGPTADTASDHFAFARELTGRGDEQGAIGELLRSLALAPASVDSRRELAAVYERLGDAASARLEYYKLLLVAPDDAAAEFSLGKLLMNNGDLEGAVEHLQLAVRAMPGSPEFRAALDHARLALHR